MDVAYVIADYRTPNLAAAARDSIRDHRPAAEVIVVDANARVKCGYSQALNIGARRLQTTPDVICFLNADVLMLEDDSPILDLFEEIPAVGIVGPRQLDETNRIAHGGIVAFEDGSDWDLDLRHRCWLWAHEPGNDADTLTRVTMDVPTVAGSSLYIRRSVLDQCDGWPEWTTFYYEDTFLCYLARHLGHRVMYTGVVTWRHYGQGAPVADSWREMMMRRARRQFVLECGRAGIPLRVWPDEDANALARETGTL